MRRITVGVSLKAYFTRAQAREWFAAVAAATAEQPAVQEGSVRVFVVPTFLQIDDAVRCFAGTPVQVGAQDVSEYGHGPFTGELCAAELAESGVRLAEIGHAERRRLFGETDAIAAVKTAEALAHGLTPVLCLGEEEQQDPAAASAQVSAQLGRGLAGAPPGEVMVAYEPIWAIGAEQPADPAHITMVARALREELGRRPDRIGSKVIYGGSAGPGLLTRLGSDIDGIFLGRFAHDPAAFIAVIDEATRLAAA